MVSFFRTSGSAVAAGGGDPYFLSLWWESTNDPPLSSDATDALARFRAMWSSLGNKIATGYTITFDGLCIGINPTNGVLTSSTSGTVPAVVNTAAGTAPLPRQTQGMIRWNTTGIVNGRRVRGRTFVPAPDEGDNGTNGQPTSSYTSQLTTAIGLLLTPGAAPINPAVWHRPGPSGGGSSHVITSGTFSPTWAVQVTRR